ncbi:unnamed protein product, partial [Meganyctiphanes norvegica]
CDYNTVSHSYLKTHIQKHICIKPFACPNCEYTCAQRSYLINHMRKHYREQKFVSPGKKYGKSSSCNQGNIEIDTKKDLLNHREYHKSFPVNSEFLCTECKMKFT